MLELDGVLESKGGPCWRSHAAESRFPSRPLTFRAPEHAVGSGGTVLLIASASYAERVPRFPRTRNVPGHALARVLPLRPRKPDRGRAASRYTQQPQHGSSPIGISECARCAKHYVVHYVVYYVVRGDGPGHSRRGPAKRLNGDRPRPSPVQRQHVVHTECHPRTKELAIPVHLEVLDVVAVGDPAGSGRTDVGI
jgi:hypothetical protein